MTSTPLTLGGGGGSTNYHTYHTHHHDDISSSPYYDSSSIIIGNHHNDDHNNNNNNPQQSEASPEAVSSTVPSLDKYVSHSSQSSLCQLHSSVREYLIERRKRKTQHGMCCVCFDWGENLFGHCASGKVVYYLSFCWPRIPIIDLVNENVFYRFVVWFLFARCYFSAIYSTRIWQWFADDRMDNILGKCDYQQDMLGVSGLSTVVLMSGILLAASLLNNAVQMSFLKRICSFLVILLAVALDISETAWSINCYNKYLFSIEISPKSYPYLNPGQSNFTFMNLTHVTQSPMEFIDLLNSTSKNMIYNIQQSQYQFISAFLILQWILAFGSTLLIIFLLVSLTIQSYTKLNKNWFNFYHYRMYRYYYHVRSLLKNISKKKTKRSFAYYATKNSQTDTSVISTSLSSLETDEIQDRLDEKIELYWENKKKSILRRLIVVPCLKVKYYATLKWILLKRSLTDYSREKWSNFFFPSRFIIGISSAMLVSLLILGTFSAFSVNIMYTVINIIYMVLTFVLCVMFSQKSDSCQASISNVLIPLFKVIESNYYLSVTITALTMLGISALIAKNYKHHVESYRNGTLQFSLKSQSMIKASNYPGLQAAHYAVATAVYFFIIYAILLVIGFACLFIKEIFMLIGILFENGLEIVLRVISFFAGKIATVVVVFILQFIFVRRRGTWLVHTTVFGVMDLILIIANYFYGFLTALIISTVKTIVFALINYVRLDSPSNPAFHAYAGMLKADTHHADPIINVFADLLKTKAKEKEIKMLQTLQEHPKLTLTELKTESNTFQQPKLKNYLKLIALLSKNQQLGQHRISMTSEFFDEETHEIKRIKFLRK